MIDRYADWHTHSSLTDGTDDPEQMAAAAARSGLAGWGLSDHVRAGSTWVPEYVARVRRLDAGDVDVRCGVEAKILDSRGSLDLPTGLAGLDYVLIADHQFPGRSGPVHPRDVKTQLAHGSLTPSAVVEQLVEASLAAAAACPAPPILAHLFSLLPKCGLSEDEVTDDVVTRLATGCASGDIRVEVNEKWRCPSPRVVRRLLDARVTVAAGSDAHRCEDIGAWHYLDEVLKRDVVPKPHG